MSLDRAPQIDEHGVEHRWGCPMTGWDSRASRVPGFHILTCPGCGVVRIVRADTAGRPTKEGQIDAQ